MFGFLRSGATRHWCGSQANLSSLSVRYICGDLDFFASSHQPPYLHTVESELDTFPNSGVVDDILALLHTCDKPRFVDPLSNNMFSETTKTPETSVRNTHGLTACSNLNKRGPELSLLL